MRLKLGWVGFDLLLYINTKLLIIIIIYTEAGLFSADFPDTFPSVSTSKTATSRYHPLIVISK